MDVVKLCGDSLVWYGGGIVARTSNGAQGNYVLQAIEQPVHYGLSGEMLLACMVHATDGV